MSSSLSQAVPKTKTDNGRDSKGRFGMGNPGGPGSKPGSGNKQTRVSVVAVLRARHGEAGLEQRTADVLDALYLEALLGSIKAAELYLAHVAELPEKGPLVAIGIGAHGPPVPRLDDLAVGISKLADIARERGLVAGEELRPLVTVDVTDPDVEDFLS